MFNRPSSSQEDARSSSQPTPCLTRGPSRASSTRVSSFGSAAGAYQVTSMESLVRAQPPTNPLRPASPSLLNRTAPTAKDMLSANIQPGFGAIPTKVQDPLSGVGIGATLEHQISQKDAENKIQAAVYFQAEDFDDDADLDLDVEDPHLKGSMPPPPPTASQLHSVTRQDDQSVTHTAVADNPRSNSSAPLPWSSSPVRPAAVSARQVPSKRLSPVVGEAVAQDTQTGEEEDVRPPSKKRRTVPWKSTDGESTSQDPDGPDHATAAAEARARIQKYRQDGGKGNLSHARETPIKGKPGSQQPWDQTASAIKEKQKRLKQSRKKPLPSLDAKDDATDDARSKKSKRVGRVFLSDEQKAVAKLVIDQEKSVFFTGSAGTGKSVLLRELIRGLQGKYREEPDRVAVTASTGLAACNIGGVTLHSFAGIGLGKESVKDLVKKVRRTGKAMDRWRRTKVLIIDEVSMVDGEMFDKLEELARIVRKSGKPFGGIQLVITGDFFQLPPVPDGGKPARFAFEAATWSTTIERKICLTQIFRQKDPVFAGMLNEMRLGRLTQKSIDTFRSLSRPIKYSDDLDATELFSTRSEVDNANGSRLRQLDGQSMVYEARDGGTITDKTQRDRLLANCMAPAAFELKKGAQVMLIKNLDESLVNGSLGKVVGFMDDREFEIFQRRDVDYELFEAMGADPDEMGRGRGKPKSKLDPDSAKVPGRKWPLVRFTNTDGTSRTILCQPEMWKIELPNGEVQASRTQVPLILAWALSIHKAQGQTLERVKVDLGRIFEKGQAYVALSRATTQEGLQVLRFDPRKVMAHDKVRQFYNSLYEEVGVAKQETPSVAKATGQLNPNAWPQDLDDEEEERLISAWA